MRVRLSHGIGGQYAALKICHLPVGIIEYCFAWFGLHVCWDLPPYEAARLNVLPCPNETISREADAMSLVTGDQLEPKSSP